MSVQCTFKCNKFFSVSNSVDDNAMYIFAIGYFFSFATIANCLCFYDGTKSVKLPTCMFCFAVDIKLWPVCILTTPKHTFQKIILFKVSEFSFIDTPHVVSIVGGNFPCSHF